MGEIFRAGIQAVPKGQMEAAIALGLSRGQALRKVILPQTMKIILPAIGNEFIAMLKDSSLVSVIALRDILRRGREYIFTNISLPGNNADSCSHLSHNHPGTLTNSCHDGREVQE